MMFTRLDPTHGRVWGDRCISCGEDGQEGSRLCWTCWPDYCFFCGADCEECTCGSAYELRPDEMDDLYDNPYNSLMELAIEIYGTTRTVRYRNDTRYTQ